MIRPAGGILSKSVTARLASMDPECGPEMKAVLRALLVKVAEAVGLKRRHFEGPRMYLERQVLAMLGNKRVKQQGRILCYHSFGQPEFGVNDVHPQQFRRHLESALQRGFRFVAPSYIASGKSGPKDIAITLDDGFKSVLDQAVPVLRDLGIPYTLFVVSKWPEKSEAWQKATVLSWQDLEYLLKQGAEIGSHSASHRDFGKLGLEEAQEELCRSRETIAARLGVIPESFAIPFGQENNWSTSTHEVALTVGYRTIYAGVEEKRPVGTVGRTFVTYYDDDRLFSALLAGVYDGWKEWLLEF